MMDRCDVNNRGAVAKNWGGINSDDVFHFDLRALCLSESVAEHRVWVNPGAAAILRYTYNLHALLQVEYSVGLLNRETGFLRTMKILVAVCQLLPRLFKNVVRPSI